LKYPACTAHQQKLRALSSKQSSAALGAAVYRYDPYSSKFRIGPYDRYEKMRSECPAHLRAIEKADLKKVNANPFASLPTSEFWRGFRYEDRVAVLQDPKLFPSAQGPAPERTDAPNGVGMLIFADEPHHSRQRRIVGPALTAGLRTRPGAGHYRWWNELHDRGFSTLLLPAYMGGAGGSVVDAVGVAVAAGRALADTALVSHLLATTALRHAPATSAQELGLALTLDGAQLTIASPRVASPASGVSSFASGPDPRAAAEAMVIRDGRLTGHLPVVPDIATSDAVLITAHDQVAGPAVLLVPTHRRGMTTAAGAPDATRQLGSLRLDDVAVDAADYLAVGIDACGLVNEVAAVGAVLLGCDAYGAALGCLDYLSGERARQLAVQSLGQRGADADGSASLQCIEGLRTALDQWANLLNEAVARDTDAGAPGLLPSARSLARLAPELATTACALYDRVVELVGNYQAVPAYRRAQVRRASDDRALGELWGGLS
jgi:hypothetical protein